MECKICLNGDNEETIINPCSCTEGVHEKCLKMWILTESYTNPLVCEICLAEYDLNYGVLFADFSELFSNRDDEENTLTDEESASQIIAVSNTPPNRNRLQETYVIYTRNVLSRRRNEQMTYCVVGSVIILIIDGVLLMMHRTICTRHYTCQENLEITTIAVTLVGIVFIIFGILDSRHRPIMNITNLYN